MEQTGEKLEDYLLSMRQISDAVYYNVIKESDFASQDKNIQRGMNLLYEANRDKLRSIAVYNNYGSLMAAEPGAAQKENPDVTRQEWYQQAMDEVENMHFSVPHIQNLFEDAAFRYHWVVSLSRAVEITENGVPQLGILLVDMDYSSISRMMKQINTFTNGQYSVTAMGRLSITTGRCRSARGSAGRTARRQRNIRTASMTRRLRAFTGRCWSTRSVIRGGSWWE